MAVKEEAQEDLGKMKKAIGTLADAVTEEIENLRSHIEKESERIGRVEYTID